MWHVQKPYSGLGELDVVTAVTVRGHRPKTRWVAAATVEWKRGYLELAAACWRQDEYARPSMQDVVCTLHELATTADCAPPAGHARRGAGGGNGGG